MLITSLQTSFNLSSLIEQYSLIRLDISKLYNIDIDTYSINEIDDLLLYVKQKVKEESNKSKDSNNV